ncbi:MAG: rod shape-determining protein MreC [Gemmatimonadota bacterium]
MASLGFILLSAVLIVLPPAAQEQVAGVLRGTVLAPFLVLQGSIQQARVRSVEMTELQHELDAALAALAGQRPLREENDRLRELLGLADRAPPGFRSASVIRAGTRGSESMFLLDAGSEDGVAINDPVVSGAGLVGLVREVGQRSAVAMDWTHPDFGVGAMTLGGEAFGLVEPRHGMFREEDRLLLNGVPYHTELEEGMAVVTSGRGGVYPRGILIGTVAELAEAEAGWRRAYWVEPAVRPAAANHILVMTGEVEASAPEGLRLWVEPSTPDTIVEGLQYLDPGGPE